MAKNKIPKINKYLEKKDLKVGEIILTNAEIAGSPVGSEAKIKEVKYDGAIFRVEITKGPKAGKEVLICADDIC